MTLSDLNAASPAAFTTALGAVYEHSPWIAESAAERRPFADSAALVDAMAEVVGQASEAEQVKLVCAHPDLAGRLARAGDLAAASASEQSGLGLDRLTDSEFTLFDRLNAAYRARFGMPFVIAVKRQTKESILRAFALRLDNDHTTELRTALSEINAIARFRLEALLGQPPSWI